MNPSVAASQTSRTANEGAAGAAKQQILSGTYGTFDFLFPLFDSMTQETKIPSILYFILLIFQFLQFDQLSHWAYIVGFLKDENVSNFYKTFNSVILYVGSPEKEQDTFTYIIVLSVVFLLVIISFIVQFFSYQSTRKYFKSISYIIRFMVEIAGPVFMIPTAAYAGWCLQIYIRRKQMLHLIFLILSVVYYIIFLIVFIVSCRLFSISPFISNSFISLWCGKDYVALFSIQSFFAFAYCFTENFPSWMPVLIILVHILAMGYEFTRFCNYQFINIKMMELLLSLIATTIVLDFISLIALYVPQIVWIVPFVAEFVVFGIAYVIIHIINKKQMKKITEFLYIPPDEIESYVEERRIKYDSDKALSRLHLGISQMCDRIIDLSYMKVILNSNDNSDILAELLKVICFFPQESRLLNHIFQAILQKRTLSFSHRFLLYQAERIKAVRQSSSSIDSMQFYSRVSQLSVACREQITTFWKHLPMSISPVSTIMKDMRKTDNQWTEILSAYPNNNRFREAYAKFLIEVKCDFSGAVMQKYYAQQIELGTIYAQDKAFRFFIRVFPHYLKKGVMDHKGNVISNPTKRKRNGSQAQSQTSSSLPISSNGSTSFGSSNTSNQLSAGVEESIGKSLFGMSRLRLAAQNAFYNRRSTYIFCFGLSIAFYFVVMFVLSVVIFVLVVNEYEHHILLVKQESTTVNSISEFVNIEFVGYLHWGEMRNLLDKFNLNFDGEVDFIFQEDTIKGHMDSAMISLGGYISRSAMYLEQRAEHGEIIQDTMPHYINAVTLYSVCDETTPLSGHMQPLPVSLIAMYHNLNDIRHFNSPASFQTSNQVCEIMTNTIPVVEQSLNVTHDNQYTFTVENSLLDSTYNSYFVIFCIGGSVITIIPLFFGAAFVFYEQHKMVRLMRTFTDDQRQYAIKPISIEETSDSSMAVHVDIDQKRDFNILAYLTLLVVVAIVPIVMCFNVLSSQQYTSKFSSALDWMYLSGIRKTYVIQTLSSLTLAILMQRDANFDPDKFMTTTKEKQCARLGRVIENAITAQRNLTQGTSTIKPLRGLTPELDLVNSLPQCTSSNTDQTSHEYFKCATLDQQLQYLSSVMTANCLSMDRLGGDLYFSLVHDIYNHVIPKIDKSDELIRNYCDSLKSTHKFDRIIFLIISLVLLFILTFILAAILMHYNKIYYTLLHIILRMPPSYIAQNPEMLNYLMKKNTNSDAEGSMSMTMKIIHASKDAIICTGANNDVEVVNKAVTQLFGYTPEQVLGQSYAFLFDDESKNDIAKQIDMMKNGQAKKTFEAHVNCVSDSNNTITCKMTLIGMHQPGEEKATSFVFILSDETEVIQRQKDAEDAKQKSEKLLYQILPMNIVLRLNSGEKNISFTVPFASVLFIDVQRFSEYAANLPPSQIMGSLSVLFSTMDELASKYELITKIKLIGDIYMAASGLFEPDDHTKAAEQALKFCLDVLVELDEVNNKLGSNLSLRVGINSGGPLIAGVLGTDKPAFDIIGDPINVAARLQTTDIAGKVQISQATFDLVNNMDVQFEKRGEVFLKGKGKSVAYLVTPNVSTSMAGALSNSGFFNIKSEVDIF